MCLHYRLRRQPFQPGDAPMHLNICRELTSLRKQVARVYTRMYSMRMRRARACQYVSRTQEPWKTVGLWRHMLHKREKVLFAKFFKLFKFFLPFFLFFSSGGALWRRMLHERDSACEAAEARIYPLYYATTRVDSRIYHPPDLLAPPAAPSPQSYPPGDKKK